MKVLSALRRFLVRLVFAAQMAGHGIFANPLRSFLTVLGVGIGVASVVSLMSIGEGARASVAAQFARLGSNVIEIQVKDPAAANIQPDVPDNLLERVQTLAYDTPLVQDTLPVKWRWTRGTATVLGVGDHYPDVRDQKMADGHFFSGFHVKNRAKVAVLGYNLARTLMNGRSPVGHTINVGGKDFLIMGVLEPRGETQDGNVDNDILIPYNVAMTLMQKTSLDAIWAKAKSPQDADLAVVQLGRIFKRMLGLDTSAPTPVPPGGGAGGNGAPGGPGGGVAPGPGGGTVPPEKGGGTAPGKPGAPGGAPGNGNPVLGQQNAKELISITNMNQMVQEADKANRVMTLLLGGIASVSLLVGGLGIMNIMLVAVSERTGEIGLRRALGAKQTDLIVQFILEALYLSGIGALAGTLSGVWGTQLFQHLGFPTVISTVAIEIAVLVALASGLIFGVYPAISAAALQPVEALRRR